MIYAGGGVVSANAAAELTELATADRFPVTCTVMGLGGFPAPHDQWLGMLGMHGTRAANYAMDEADLIVAIGARFDDRITGKLSEFAPRAKFIHIDIDPAEISKNVPAHIPIVGDAKNILPRLTAEYRALERRCRPARGVVVAHPTPGRSAIRSRYDGLQGRRDQAPVHGPGAVRGDRGRRDRRPATSASTRCGRRSTSTSPGPRRWINSGGLGTMGFGLPAAMGAKVGCPDETVVCIAGDGSVQMNMQELATCAQEGIAIKVFIMNNGYLGMVRQWQELFWDKRYSQVEMGQWPDFVKLAEAYGATGMRFEDKTHAGQRHAGGDRHRRSGAGRRPRHARGEHVSDDPGRASPRATWWAERMGEPGTKEILSLDELEAVAGLRTGRKHILSILVENKPGVLTRIAGLFARRGFNIDTLAVGPTDDETVSRITLTLDGAVHPIDQVTKQLHKLVNVLKIRDLEPEETLARELALFKVSADGASPRRGHADLRDLPRQGRRRDQALGRGRGHRDLRQGGRVRAARAAVRADRDGAHRRDRDLPRPGRDVGADGRPRFDEVDD